MCEVSLERYLNEEYNHRTSDVPYGTKKIHLPDGAM